MSDIAVLLNGEASTVQRGTTVAELVRAAVGTTAARGLAVAVNASLVPRGRWEMTTVDDGDRIELLSAAQGG
ncbi:MAG TPA: sulfur carrier protein ThiS [Candidatus Sulfotelmatobacter sp.]|nr:sulfur carrier protein ThiS [Candidatus Sulfotelmatobacter sp.]